MLTIRPIQACDNQAIRDIEIKCYRDPWLPAEFTYFGRATRVAIADGKVAGYYCVLGTKLLRLGVSPSWRRMAIGSQLVAAAKVESGKLTIVLPEIAHEGHLFLRANGFRCVNILRNKFNDLGVVEDGFYFLWKRAWE